MPCGAAQIAQLGEAIGETVVVDATRHDEQVAGPDRGCRVDHPIAVIAVRGDEDGFDVERDQSGVVEPSPNL